MFRSAGLTPAVRASPAGSAETGVELNLGQTLAIYGMLQGKCFGPSRPPIPRRPKEGRRRPMHFDPPPMRAVTKRKSSCLPRRFQWSGLRRRSLRRQRRLVTQECRRPWRRAPFRTRSRPPRALLCRVAACFLHDKAPLHDLWDLVRMEKGKDADAAWAEIYGAATPSLANLDGFFIAPADDGQAMPGNCLCPVSRPPLDQPPDKHPWGPFVFGPFRLRSIRLPERSAGSAQDDRLVHL